MNARELQQKIRVAWADVTAPSGEYVEKALEWSLCDISQDALLGIAPMDVDIHSPGFDAATPLFDLPSTAAAAYLGTFLLSLIDGLEFQEKVGIFDDLLTRAHTLACLTNRRFCDEAIRKSLPKHRQEVVADVVLFLVAKRDDLALSEEDVEVLLELAQSLRQ